MVTEVNVDPKCPEVRKRDSASELIRQRGSLVLAYDRSGRGSYPEVPLKIPLAPPGIE